MHNSIDLRIALALLRIRSVLPASLFFDGPSNSSFDSTRPSHRSTFHAHASQCDARLQLALTTAGLPDATWKWDELPGDSDRSPAAGTVITNIRVHSLHASASSDFARAFACEVCSAPGSATRQCAACARLVCTASTCSVGCHEDTTPSSVGSPSLALQSSDSIRTSLFFLDMQDFAGCCTNAPQHRRCAFTVCVACHDATPFVGPDGSPGTAGGKDNLGQGNRPDFADALLCAEPHVSAPICECCPASLLRCPAHIDSCIRVCEECDARACIPCGTNEAAFYDAALQVYGGPENCFICQRTICGKFSCQAEGFTMWLCSKENGTPPAPAGFVRCDFEQVCSNCAAPGNTCPVCHGSLVPYQ